MNTKEIEQFINRIRAIYANWDLKLMVLLTLTLQIMLMFLGARRKFTSNLWVRAIVWSSYISADSIAILALGMLSSKLGNINTDDLGFVAFDDNTRLLSLWSPCLLLLLGGPDSITAYSLEDNELWLRHLMGLVVQTTGAGYIYFLSWSVSYLSFLSILMFVAALIKYGERVWVLWQASKSRRNDSMLDKADPSPNYPRFMDKYTLKQLEGYHVTADEVFEIQLPPPDLAAPAPTHSIMISDADELVMAYRFFQIFKRLFVDLILSSDDRDAIKSIFTGGGLTWEKAFKVIEIELGFMYDLLHTKAVVLFTHWGIYRRSITSIISCIVLVVFAISRKPHYHKLDLAATFLLLSSIIFIEIYSVITMLASDWVGVWMCNDVITSIPIRYVVALVQKHLRQPRWSNCVGQLSFFSFSVKAKPLPCYRALKLLSLDKKLDKFYYTSHKKIIDYIKDKIWIGIQYGAPDRNFEDHNGLLSRVLFGEAQSYGRGDSSKRILLWATKFEFDQAILIWHIATELCYYSYKHQNLQVPQDMVDPRKSSKLLSRYLYYLLERYPFMLPNGIGQIRLRDTLAEALKFFNERGLFTDVDKHKTNCLLSCFYSKKSKQANKKKKRQELRKLAHTMLLEVNTEVPPNKVKGGQSKSVLFDACILAKALIENVDHSNKWLLIVRSLLVLMYSAAYRCRGDIHAQQLRRGGELMSHVWMMMAHFGLTDHFQMTQGHAIAKLVLN